MKLYVGLLLHAYQPYWQYPHVLQRIINETYLPNFTKIIKDPRYRMTLNIQYALVELFQKFGYAQMLDLVTELAEAENVELTDTLGYHALAPLISVEQFETQVEIQRKLGSVLKVPYQSRGFFLPELAYAPELVSSLLNSGATWTVTDDPLFEALHGFVPYNFIPEVGGLGVFLRSKLWSFDKIADTKSSTVYMDGRDLAYQLASGFRTWTAGNDAYVILAMDFETFDHHNVGYWDYCLGRFVDTIYSERPFDVEIELATLSDIFDRFKKVSFEVPKGSWSTSKDQWQAGNYFPLWQDPGYYRGAHAILSEIAAICGNAPHHTGATRLKEAAALASCAWWWIPYNGNFTFALMQAHDLVETARAAKSNEIESAERLFTELEEMSGITYTGLKAS